MSRSQVPRGPTWGSKYAAMWKRLELGAWSRLLALERGERGVLETPGMTRKSWQALITHTGLHTTHTKWLVQSWSTLGARTSHGQHGHTRLTTARTWGKPPPSPFRTHHGTFLVLGQATGELGLTLNTHTLRAQE
jgi:hypothetical protein